MPSLHSTLHLRRIFPRQFDRAQIWAACQIAICDRDPAGIDSCNVAGMVQLVTGATKDFSLPMIVVAFTGPGRAIIKKPFGIRSRCEARLSIGFTHHDRFHEILTDGHLSKQPIAVLAP